MCRKEINSVRTGAPSPFALGEPRNTIEIRNDPTKFNIINTSTNNIFLCVTVIFNISNKLDL